MLRGWCSAKGCSQLGIGATGTIAVLANHRGTPVIGPGQLETYSEFAVKGIAALTKLPL